MGKCTNGGSERTPKHLPSTSPIGPTAARRKGRERSWESRAMAVIDTRWGETKETKLEKKGEPRNKRGEMNRKEVGSAMTE